MLALALIAGESVAQTAPPTASDKPAAAKPATAKPAAAKPVAAKPADGKPADGTSAETKPAAKKPAAPKVAAANPASGEKPKTSTIILHSLPMGVKVVLSNKRACVTPCRLVVAYNEKFTAVATKAGYNPKEVDVSPSITNGGKAYMVGMAIGAGVIGLAVSAATAPREYGPEPIVIEMTKVGGGGPVSARPAGMQQ